MSRRHVDIQCPLHPHNFTSSLCSPSCLEPLRGSLQILGGACPFSVTDFQQVPFIPGSHSPPA